MTVPEILDMDAFEECELAEDYGAPMAVDTQPSQATAEADSDHVAGASTDMTESSEGETEEEDGMEEEEAEEDDTRNATLSLLEGMVLDVLEQLSDALASLQNKQVVNKKRVLRKLTVRLADRRKPVQADGSPGTRCMVFPQNQSYASSKGIAQLFRVLDLMHAAVAEGVPTTKRDIFYKDVVLFGSQATVNKLVDDVAATIGVERADLHVRASAKGLFCGAGLTVYMRHGDVVQGSAYESTLIPPSEDIARFDISETLSWVLVVEKEAIFQTLCHLGFSETSSLPGTGLIITGKGYPDVATRQLLCTLSANLPSTIPLLALVDADPYGIDILSTYKRGSASMAHQRDALAAPRVRWAGVMASELAGLGIGKDALLPITRHDEEKALSMLRRPDLPRKWRKELQHMLFTRRKAEIEVLCAAAGAVGPNSACGEEQNEDEDYMAPRQRENTLVQYLVAKIGKAVDSCGAKSREG